MRPATDPHTRLCCPPIAPLWPPHDSPKRRALGCSAQTTKGLDSADSSRLDRRTIQPNALNQFCEADRSAAQVTQRLLD